MKLHFVGEGIVGYRRYMLFKQYLNTISHSKIIQEKLVLIKFFDKWGAKATRDAYGVSRSTVYEWKKRYRESKYDPKSLLPLSKRPKRVRRSNIDPLIIEFIRKLRFENYRLGKSKIKVRCSSAAATSRERMWRRWSSGQKRPSNLRVRGIPFTKRARKAMPPH